MKLCINCHTLNAPDEIFCSECGMSLINVPTGEEALQLRKVWEADQAEGARPSGMTERPSDATEWNPIGAAGAAIALGLCLVLCIVELVAEDPSSWRGGAILIGIVVAGVVAVCIWVAAMALGAWLTDWWGGRGRRSEARRLGAFMTDTHTAGKELSRSDLEGADARQASLEGAMLVEANLAEANLQRAILSQARLAGANLSGANLCRTNLAGAELSRADLEGANAAEASMEGATLVEANLTGANLRTVNLSRANLEGSGLSRANLLRARLCDANLERADLLSAYLYGADLQAAVLKEANLEKADLRYARLGGANLQGTRLAGAHVDSTTVMPEGWEEIVASKPQDEPPSQRAVEAGSTVTVAGDTAPRSMMRLCPNCQTENAADAVLCSSCGMGLTRVTKPDEAEPADTTVREALDGLQIAKFMWGWVLVAMGLAAMVCALAASLNPVITLAGLLYGVFGAWMILSVGIRLAGRDTRTQALMWAGGPLAGGAFAVAWLALASVAAVFMTILADSLDWGISPSLVLGGTFVLLFLSGLVVAPLVGAIIVVVDWLRGRSKNSDVLPAAV